MAEASLEERCQDAVAGTVEALTLEGTDGRTYTQLGRDLKNSRLPAALVLAPETSDDLGAWDTENDRVKVPVAVLLVDRAAGDQPSRRNRHLAWRQALRGAFVSRRLSGVAECYGTDLRQPGDLGERLPEYLVLEQGFVVDCLCVVERA